MDLIIIRHGDPDYEHDTLTEHGWKEAEILSHRISQLNVRDFYVSPLGRAQDTASCTLKVMNRTIFEDVKIRLGWIDVRLRKKLSPIRMETV